MRKLLFLFALLLTSIGAWAQEQEQEAISLDDGIYTIANVYNQRGTICYGTKNGNEYFGLTDITLNGYADRNLTPTSDEYKYWYITTKNGVTYIYNIGKGVFLQTYSNEKASCLEYDNRLTFSFEKRTKNGTDYVCIKSQGKYVIVACGYYPERDEAPIRWGNYEEAASLLTITKVEDGLQTYSTQVALANEEISSLEFKPSDAPTEGQWAKNTNWFQLKNQVEKVLRTDALTSEGYLALTNSNTPKSDVTLWCVVGDAENGYKFYNKAKGTGLVLGMKGAEDAAYAELVSPDAEGYTTTFDIVATTDARYLCIKEHGSDNNYWNQRNGRLAYWADDRAQQGDDGSSFLFTEVDLSTITGYATEGEIAAAAELIKVAPGYPKTTTSEYSALNDLVNMTQVVSSDLSDAITAYKTCSDVLLPENGKAYTFTAKFQNGNMLYMKYVNGQKLRVSASSSDASTFVCKELRAGVYAFITEDGKILTWVGKDDNTSFYKEDDKLLGYSANYATVYNSVSDWNEITVKKNDASEEQFGLLRLVGRRSTTESTKFSSFYANKDGGFQQANDGNLFNNDNTSGWILAKVEHEANNAQNAAIAEIDATVSAFAHVDANAGKLGNGIGCAYYMDGETKLTDAATAKVTIGNATSPKVINAIKNSYSKTLPSTATAYKMAFKTKAGTSYYLKADDASLSTSTNESDASVFYCMKNGNGEYSYVFISEAGKYLKYHGSSVSTSENTLTAEYTVALNNFKVELMVDKTGNINSNLAARLGTVCITTDNRASDNTTDGCYIIRNSNNPPTFDASGAPYHKDDLTSAIVMTEVENYTAPDAMLASALHISKLNAKAHVEANQGSLGDGLGYANYTAGETKITTAEDAISAIEAATTIEAVESMVNSFAFEIPTPGVAYALYDKTHGVYVDIHKLGYENAYQDLNQMATLNSYAKKLYITADPLTGFWKIHTTVEGGSYLCQYTGGKQTWDSWVSPDAGDFYWEVEPTGVDGEIMLKNTGSAGGYLGTENHTNGNLLYANQTDAARKIKLQLIKVPSTVPVYRPTTRATTLEAGKKYFIYNTAFNGDEDRTGFLYDNGSNLGHTGSPKKKPSALVATDKFLWEVVATDEEGKYYLRAADGGYVNATGKTDNANPVALYILPWTTSTTDKAGVKSEAADGIVLENANIGADVFTIGGTKSGHSGQDCWNGNANTFSAWESAHPYAFYEYEEDEVALPEGYPVPGHTYYIYCDNDTRQYFHNEGGTLKVSEKRTEWSSEYLFTCTFDGQYFQFKNMKGKYLKHQGLQDAAYNFELAIYLDGVNLKTPGGKYFVMNTDNSFSQADRGDYNPANTNYSTVYKFEEFIFPKDGEEYYIYADTYQDGDYVNRYMYADGGNLKLNTTLTPTSAYKWTCIVTNEGKVQFRNGNGKYLKHKGVQDAPYNFTLTKSNATHPIAATLYSDADSRYFVVKNDGSGFDQSTDTYNQTTASHCTDFVIMPVSDVQVLSITPNCRVAASAIWNDETKKLPASWTITPNTTVSDATLSIECRETFDLVGLFDGETPVGNTVEIESLDADYMLTAKFTPAFFSSKVGEKWVNVSRKADSNHAMFLGSAEENAMPTFNKKDFSDVGMMWSFVGTPDNFKIYNYLSGGDYALTPSVESIGNGTEVKMVAPANAKDWHLITYEDGFAIAPVGNNDKGLNSYGGASSLGGNIKFYNATDDGSQWSFEIIDTENVLTYGISVDKIHESSPRVAELTFGVDGVNNQTRITESIEPKVNYMPKGAVLSISSMTYRGYTLNGVEGVDDLNGFTIPEGGLDLNVAYTANDERILFYSPSATGHPYRIPAIATAPNGDIFAICDHRPCGGDIGNGDVDIVVRISKDNGETWGEEFKIADGDGGSTNRMETGYGDAAIVVDRESNKIIVMMVAGRTKCGDSRWDASKIGVKDAAAVNRAARIYGTLNESTGEWDWTQPEEVTDDIYKLFLDDSNNATVTSYFIGSGKICQSRVVKKGQYYRLYCSIWTNNGGNRVIYSDDFGQSWNVLGTIADRPASGGDEPKVEELRDGTVVLSSRVGGGRYFNLFTFNDDTYTTGSWGEVAKSTTAYDGSTGTNGEIYKVKAIRKEDGQICDVMLQSVPAGPGRYNVTVYYKEMDYTTGYTPATFAADWKVGKQVSYRGSAYSTMIMQADGRLGFLFEEEPNSYNIVYIPYSIEDVTDGKYSLYTVRSTITSAKIGTFYASEAMQIPEGIKAYVATEKPSMNGTDAEGNATGVITMTELEGIIPANTGAVLRGAADNYEFIPSISYGTPVANNMMVGYEAADNKAESKGAVTLPDVSKYTTYVLAVENEVAGFYRKDANFNVGNNKAYMQIPTSVVSSARAIYFSFDDNTTGLEGVFESESVGDIFDLQGRRVNKTNAKGIYIVNGKKVLK